MTYREKQEYDYLGRPIGSTEGIANLSGGNTYDYLEELRGRVATQEDYVRRLRQADLQARLEPSLRGGTFRGNVAGGSMTPYGILTGGPANTPSGGSTSSGSSVPWNDPAAFSLGNTNPYVHSNVLLDPLLDGLIEDEAANLSTSYSTLSSAPDPYDRSGMASQYAWRAKMSGPGSARCWQITSRIKGVVNPFASGIVALYVAAASGTTEVILESNTFDQSYGKYVPYLVASATITGAGYSNTLTNVTTARLYIEIVEYEGSGTVKASTYLDLTKEVPPDGKFRRFWASVLGWGASNNNVLRLRLEVVATGTGGKVYAPITEPFFGHSWSPDPPPFNPLFGRVNVLAPASVDVGDGLLTSVRKSGDTAARLGLGALGSVRWGPGSSAYLDARLWRSGAGTLTIDGAGPSSTIVIPDLKGFWRFNEASGATAEDLVGTNDGTYNGTITQGVTGPVPGDPTSKGITLDGSTGYVSIPDHADIDLGDGPWTIAMRVKQDLTPPASRRQLLDKGTNAYGIYFPASSTAPRLEKVGEGDIAVYPATVGAFGWAFFAFTKNGSTIGFYAPDGLDRTSSLTITNRTLSDSSSALQVGRQQAGTAYYDNSVADLMIFKRVLSADEVRLLWQQEKGGGQATLDIAGALKVSGYTSPSQLTANTDNWTPAGLHTAMTLNISSDAARNLTGIEAGTSGEMHLLTNTGSYTITLVHDATSTAANRFWCPGATNYSLLAKGSVLIVYNAANSRWAIVG